MQIRYDTFVPFHGPPQKENQNNRFIAWTGKFIEYSREKEKITMQTDMELLHQDNRGEIRRIGRNGDLLRITCNKGSSRGKHYHEKHGHVSWCINGVIEYYERPVKQDIKPLKVTLKPGDCITTTNMVEHEFVALEDSIFDCYSYGSRDRANYEKDLVKLSYSLKDIYDNWND